MHCTKYTNIKIFNLETVAEYWSVQNHANANNPESNFSATIDNQVNLEPGNKYVNVTREVKEKKGITNF